MNRRLKISVFSALLAMSSLSAVAEEAAKAAPETLLEAIQQGKPMTSFRLRYENVDQEGYQSTAATAPKLKTGEAFTLRSLIGWQTASFKNFSFGVQLTDVHEFTDDFNDRRDNQPEHNNGTGSPSLDKRQYPNIVDPGYTDINQLYVDWTGINNTKLRLGRQQLNLDNVRFIGDIGFRQNMQVFDGISVLNKSIPNTEIFAAHFGKVRQITTKLRDGNIDILNAKYKISPTESLIGYGYFIDVENLGQNSGNPTAVGTAAQGGNGLGGSSDIPASPTNINPNQTDASSKTFGLRLDGTRKINDNWKVLYTAEYAKQDDYRGGNSLIDAHYFKLGGGAGYGNWSLRIDHEKLSSNDGKYAFQTPLGTNHLFQGWADVFLVTPRQGMEDTFITLSGSIMKAKLYAEYHVLKSDENFQSLGGRLRDKYGTEFDASVLYPFTDKINGKIEYANYRESDVYGVTLQNAARKGDKEMFWITGMYTF
ncbi:MAG TPA: alginate export family protein [Methylotenera sp.]|nr:alginate export family protein [Methylotenera sp.]HPV44614.1 alginate export family protein [Methylotenera sp.]